MFSPTEDDPEEMTEVVATKWLRNDNQSVLWPTSKKSQQSMARRKVMSLAEPALTWPVFSIRFERSYGKYSLIYFVSFLDNLKLGLGCP